MPLQQTQPKRGYPRVVDGNDTDRTGREDGTRMGQSGRGYPHTTDSNDTERKRPAAEGGLSRRGAVYNDDSPVPEATQINNHSRAISAP